MKFRPLRRRNSKRSFDVEVCERRSLMASNAFAVIEGHIPEGQSTAEVRFHVDPKDFDIERHALSFVVRATGENGQILNIGKVTGIDGAKTAGQQRNRFGSTFVKLVEGDYRFVVHANPVSGQRYRVEFALAGDLDGNGSVDGGDFDAARSSFGARFGTSRYLAAADINGSGGIGHADLALLRGNLGNATSLRPLVNDPSFDRLDETSRLVTLEASGKPGTNVVVHYEDDSKLSGVIGAGGLATFQLYVDPGHTPVSMTSTDSFGQSVRSTHSVVRTSTASYLGVGFEPYVKQWIPGSNPPAVPLWNSYETGNASVANQVNLVAPHFSFLSTYATGYAPYYGNGTPWNKVDSNWMVASEAAKYNKTANSLKVTVNQGLFQKTDLAGNLVMDQMNIEIANGFSIAADANATYSGTVKRLIFTNEYVTSALTTSAVNQLITANKAAAHAQGIEVGVRSQTFGQLNDPNSPYLAEMQALVKNVDFIMLNIYPFDATKGIPAGIANLDDEYTKIKNAAVALNPNIEVLIGETGWPSQGLSFNDTTGASSTVANAKAYYDAVKAWATNKQVETSLFEAIDEPWKSNQNPAPPPYAPPVWQGPNGAEGHFGIWTYSTSDDNGTFTAKFAL